MNYFRSRFQRETSSYGMDSESFLRDFKRRKNEEARQSSVTSYSSPNFGRKNYGSSSFLELPSPFRRETSTWIEPRTEPPPPARSQSPLELKKNGGSSFFRSLRSLSRMSSGSSTKDLDEIENIPVCNNIQVDLRDPIKIPNDDDKPGKDKFTSNYVTEESGIEFSATPILSTSGFGGGNGSPYKRRRETEVENQTSHEDDNPFTKRNFERQNNISQLSTQKEEEVVVKPERRRRRPEPEPEEEEIDPLSLIEIKSAIQWKAMSKRISFNFDDEEKPRDASIGHEQQQQQQQLNATSEPVIVVKEVTPKEKRHRTRRSNRPITYSIKPVAFESKEDFKPTTVPQLRLVCWKIKPWKEPKSFKLFSSQFGVQWGVDCDEVFPGLFIGDKASAMNIGFLKRYGITHVLNTAEGKEEGLVDLSQEYFEDSGISYLGFPLWDTPTCNLLPFMGCAADFIEEAISKGGKCMVNCQMGVSRSASCAMGYLMIKQGMLAVDVMTMVRKSRDCRPNDGFLEQLVELDNDLRRHRELGLQRKLVLSTLEDRDSLPNPWNFEFWTQEVAIEDLGMPLVRLGEPHPLLSRSTFSSLRTSTVPSRNLSRKPSSSGDYIKGLSRRSSLGVSNSFRKSRSSSRQCSRHESLSLKPPNSRPQSKCLSLKASEAGDENEDDWEWVWEDDEDINNGFEERKEEVKLSEKDEESEGCLLTTEAKLEEVKNIIEKPEERWRVLWHQPRLTESPPSPCGSSRSFSSSINQGSWNNRTSIQAGVDDDPLSLVKVSSARHWKAISHRLTINFEGMELEENKEDEVTPIYNDVDVDTTTTSPNVVRPSTPTEFKPTTAQQLRLICWRVKPWDSPKDRNLYTSVMATGWGVDCDEVHPNIFIGDKASAQNVRFLQKMGITHVLNAAEGGWEGSVELSQDHYAETGIQYLGLPLWDDVNAKILPYLGCANEFIASAFDGRKGKCLVNCQMGVSRSCAAAMSYMMITLGWKAVDVLRTFRTRRDVRPNDTFMEQLADLDNDLRKYREHGVVRKFKLASLSEVHQLPRPWHFEFWETIPDDLPFVLSHVGDPRVHCNNINNGNDGNDNNVDIVINDQMDTANNKSEPITITVDKPHLYLTKFFQTTDERQEVTLPSPARSRPNSYSTTVCLKVAASKSKTPDSTAQSLKSSNGNNNDNSSNNDDDDDDESSEWDWEYYTETEEEDEESRSSQDLEPTSEE